MELTIIILFALLIGAILWGAYCYMWYLAHKNDVIFSQSRAARIKAITGREDINYFYTFREYHGAYFVNMYDIQTGYIPIKRFYDEDKEYAKLCAEELCDKLNENL